MNASFSSKAFGVAAILGGAPMVVVPNSILDLLRMPTADGLWVRLWGMEVVVLGFYYLAAGRANAHAFFVASVPGRLAFCAALVALVLVWSAPWQVLIVGGLDALGAAWTLAALRREGVDLPDGSRSGWREEVN